MATWGNGCTGKMDDHSVYTTPNHHPTKMDGLPKTFAQIILAAKWLLWHSNMSPRAPTNSEDICLPFCLYPSSMGLTKEYISVIEGTLSLGQHPLASSKHLLQTEQGEVGWANVCKMQGGAVPSITGSNIQYTSGKSKTATSFLRRKLQVGLLIRAHQGGVIFENRKIAPP